MLESTTSPLCVTTATPAGEPCTARCNNWLIDAPGVAVVRRWRVISNAMTVITIPITMPMRHPIITADKENRLLSALRGDGSGTRGGGLRVKVRATGVGDVTLLIQFVHQRNTGGDVQLGDVGIGNASRCLTKARRELPWAAMSTFSPLSTRGRISSLK